MNKYVDVVSHDKERMAMRTVDIKDSNYSTVVTDAELIDAPLWWHDQGLMQTASGCGRKLTTRYKVQFNGRVYRVYCTQFSNAGTLWFNADGRRLLIV